MNGIVLQQVFEGSQASLMTLGQAHESLNDLPLKVNGNKVAIDERLT